MKIDVPTCERIELKDEWDTLEMCKIFEEKKRVMIRASLSGSGKSFACERMQDLRHNVLFDCPTNKLVQKYGLEGVTINRFFSMSISNDIKMPKFDDSEYDTIVFDEIYFSDIQKLSRIHKYSNENPDKNIIATGDTSQLQPINELSNQFEYAKYADDCINQIFKYEIFLNENKRLKSDADKEKLKQIKKDIFNKSIPLADTIKKYFKFTTNITNSEHNIAYMNDTCKTVANTH